MIRLDYQNPSFMFSETTVCYVHRESLLRLKVFETLGVNCGPTVREWTIDVIEKGLPKSVLATNQGETIQADELLPFLKSQKEKL